MARRRYTVDQIISKLREAEVELAKGLKVPEVARKLGISEYTYYRSRKEYGGSGPTGLGPRMAEIRLTGRGFQWSSGG